MDELWRRTIVEPLQHLWAQTLDYLPNVFTAVVVLAAGLLVALVVRQVLSRGLRALGFDRGAERLGLASAFETVGFHRGSSHAMGQCAQGFVLLVTLLLVLNALGPAGSELVLRFFIYLPHLLVALVILFVGRLAAGFFGRTTLLAAVNAQMPNARLAAGAVQLLIWLLTIALALEHLGIGRTTVAVTFGVILGGIVAGLAVAFGLAGKELARQALESWLKPRARGEEEEGVRHL